MSEEKKEIYCSQCGCKQDVNTKFCSDCGNKLETVVPEEINQAEEATSFVYADSVETTIVPQDIVDLNQYDQQPQYNQQPQYYEETSNPVKQTNGKPGFAIASMICGILSLLCCCLAVFSVILGVAAIVLGIIVIYNKYDGKGMAIAGIVTGCICLVFSVILVVLGSLGFFAEFMDAFTDGFKDGIY